MKKNRILFVDDEVAFTNMLRLRLPKFEVCVENDPLQAIETAVRFKPDLIFLDVVMPGADGGTVAAQLQENPDLRAVPIVFMTAIVSEAKAGSDKKIHGYEFIAKPVTVERIIACINAYLPG